MASDDAPLGTRVPEVTNGAGGRSRWVPIALIAVVAFLLGAAAGAMVTSATQDDDPEVIAVTTTTTTTVPDRDEGRERACLDAVDAALDALDVLTTAAGAVSDLDAPALERAIGRIDEVRPEVTETLERCRRAAG